LRGEIVRRHEPVMSHPCYLLKLICAAAFYLIAMPSPAAAELATAAQRALDLAGARSKCAILRSVNDAAGKAARSGKICGEPIADAGSGMK
jgi:2-oxo-4-hydroxy-4-carboxy--5-ureidoimidazoline (OHCU) decarboxylase